MSETERDEEAFRALVGSLEDLVFVWKTSGEMLFVNDAFVRVTGLTAEDFGFQNRDNPFIHPDDLPHVLAELAAFTGSGALRSPPLSNRFIDAWGKVHSLVSIAHKITWRGESALLFWCREKTSAEPARDADADYRHLVENADDGIVKLSGTGRVVYSNRRFQELVGLRAVELAKRELPELFASNDRESVVRALERLRAGSPRESFEARLAEREGRETTWLAVNASQLGDRDDTFVFLAIARDVTPARRLQAKLREAQRLESLGTLAGGIAHDFNNIVTGVLANVTLAESMLEPGSPLTEMLRDIRVAAERATALNTSLLAYVGQAPQRAEVIDLEGVASDAVRMLSPLVPKGVKVSLETSGEPARVLADPGQLSQVIVNLITNGAQAIGARGGRVDVSISVVDHPGQTSPDARFFPGEPAPGCYSAIRVTDDGSGMTPAVLERIFEPFFSTKGLGRGLGLSATLGIVGQHSGAIQIHSEPGRGSTFEVLLPLFQGQAAARAPAGVARELTSGGAVLFVDDEEIVRQVGRRILERAGYQVVLASNGTEALELFTTAPERFCVMILDHSMPGMRGDEVARNARSLRPDLPLIKTSGYRDVFDPDVDRHNTVVLPKPYTRTALLDAVSHAIAGDTG